MIRALLAGAAMLVASQAIASDLTDRYATPCGVLPPPSARHEPTVPYTVSRLSPGGLQLLCARGAIQHQLLGCAIPPPSPNSPDHWTIAIKNDMSNRDTACVILYEKAHLAPNNWIDPTWEAYLHSH